MLRHSSQAALAFTIAFMSVSADAAGQDAPASQTAPSPHQVRTAKFTIDDVETSTAFYEDLAGMTEVGRYVAEGRLVEPFMGFGDGGRIGLLGYIEKETIEKSPYPVAVLYTPDLDALARRFDDASYPLSLYSGDETGGVRIAIASDPSGNAIEFVERAGAPAVGGSRLIVDDRQEAEDFFVRIFGVTPGLRFQTDAFDEVLMDFGAGMFVALFEPKGVPPLPKSRHPVVAIYSTEFDAVLQRVTDEGLGHRRLGAILLANDPSGNVVEVVPLRPQ